MPATFIAPPKIPSATGMPRYAQIAANLEARIAAGKLAPGTRLPAERALAEKLRVNRVTLRQALNELEAKGLLIRRWGAGTYVAERVIERQAGKLVSFTNGMQRLGFTPGAKILRLEKRAVEFSLAAHLQIHYNAPVYELHRLRFVNAEPVLLERFTIPVERCPNLEKQDLEHRSIYEVLRKEYSVKVVGARQSLEPVIADASAAKWLDVRRGAALMLERRLSFDARGVPVEYGNDLYRGDRFRFVTERAAVEL